MYKILGLLVVALFNQTSLIQSFTCDHHLFSPFWSKLKWLPTKILVFINRFRELSGTSLCGDIGRLRNTTLFSNWTFSLACILTRTWTVNSLYYVLQSISFYEWRRIFITIITFINIITVYSREKDSSQISFVKRIHIIEFRVVSRYYIIDSYK